MVKSKVAQEIVLIFKTKDFNLSLQLHKATSSTVIFYKVSSSTKPHRTSAAATM